MKWSEQGTARYVVVPRTLTFLTHGEEVLLLRGAPDKRLWAGKLNGVGGHVEPGEHPLDGARREVLEETGLAVQDLRLRAIVHVQGQGASPGVMLFVFVGRAPSRKVRPSREGSLAWYPIARLPRDELVEDLAELLPRALVEGRFTFGLYRADPTSGWLSFQFDAILERDERDKSL